ncbi:MAG: chalcone isomerase family protein, partial [Elusimicrobiota bacterium]
TAKKLSEGFIELIEEHNTPELVEAHKEDIKKFASWFDKDMVPGETSKTTYVPGEGLTFEYMGEIKGTIPGNEFAKMYYRYTFGENANNKMKNGYLGIEK